LHTRVAQLRGVHVAPPRGRRHGAGAGAGRRAAASGLQAREPVSAPWLRPVRPSLMKKARPGVWELARTNWDAMACHHSPSSWRLAAVLRRPSSPRPSPRWSTENRCGQSSPSRCRAEREIALAAMNLAGLQLKFPSGSCREVRQLVLQHEEIDLRERFHLSLSCRREMGEHRHFLASPTQK